MNVEFRFTPKKARSARLRIMMASERGTTCTIVTSTGEDAEIEAALRMAFGAIKQACGEEFASESFAELGNRVAERSAAV